MTENSLIKVDLGDTSKVGIVLIEKISNALGGAFRPFQTVRVAKADAKAEMIHAKSQIAITGLQQRAVHRFLKEEEKKQANIEDIAQKAVLQLKQESLPENVEDDWITNFFDKCRIVSDEDMQNLWSQVLAGEANSPGAFSRKTVNLLADLNKGDAELFRRMCSFGWMMVDKLYPLVYDHRSEIYGRHGIRFDTLCHLEVLGLVQLHYNEGFTITELPQKSIVSYYGRPVELTLPDDPGNELHGGTVFFTRAGEELAPVCGSKPVDGFFEYVYDRWAGESLVPKRETEQRAPANDA